MKEQKAISTVNSNDCTTNISSASIKILIYEAFVFVPGGINIFWIQVLAINLNEILCDGGWSMIGSRFFISLNETFHLFNELCSILFSRGKLTDFDVCLATRLVNWLCSLHIHGQN